MRDAGVKVGLGVDGSAHIVAGGVVDHLNLAGVGVDFDLGNVGAETVGRVFSFGQPAPRRCVVMAVGEPRSGPDQRATEPV